MKQELRVKIALTLPIADAVGDDAFRLAEFLKGVQNEFNNVGMKPILAGGVWKMDAVLVRPRAKTEVEGELDLMRGAPDPDFAEVGEDPLDIPASMRRTA